MSLFIEKLSGKSIDVMNKSVLDACYPLVNSQLYYYLYLKHDVNTRAPAREDKYLRRSRGIELVFYIYTHSSTLYVGYLS